MMNANGAASEHRAETKIRWTLQLVFGLGPIVAGLDKFTNLLTVWEHDLAPSVVRMLPMTQDQFGRWVNSGHDVQGSDRVARRRRTSRRASLRMGRDKAETGWNRWIRRCDW